GALKDERAAEPLAGCLGDFQLRGHAVVALKALGPAAEKAVLRLLEHPDVGIRVRACGILQEVGTRASVPALEKAAKDDHAGYAAAAAKALQAIAGRKP